MRAIVLIKQVPDLRLGGVGVRADGTIDRSAAAPITNPADMHAVEAAVQLADDVCALSMGPPAADEALRQALAAGANRAVLLCDHALAGSDTWATANALAAAIEWIGGADLVLCGISAIDGETGQVGPVGGATSRVAPGHRLRVAGGRRQIADRPSGRRRWIRAVAPPAAGGGHGGRDRVRAPLPDPARPAKGGDDRDRARHCRRRRRRGVKGRPGRIADEGRQDDPVTVARSRLSICRRRRGSGTTIW